jgi:hypothetical protein
MENSKLLQLLSQVHTFEELVILYIDAKTGDHVNLADDFGPEVLSSFKCVDTFIDDHNTRSLINRREPDLI